MKNRITLLREQKGLTLVELADLVSVTRKTMSAIERDLYTPSLLLAYDIAEALKVNIADVFPPALTRAPSEHPSPKPWFQ